MSQKPAVLENERISTAQVRAPLHSKMECGTPGVRMKPSPARPKPAPGVVTMFASASRWSKNFQLSPFTSTQTYGESTPPATS